MPPKIKNKKLLLLFKILSVAILCAVFCVAYYLLLHENSFHASIDAIIGSSYHMSLKKHLFTLGLLPIYIAIMVFGAGILGLYLGGWIERFIAHFIQKHPVLSKKLGLRNLAKPM